MAFVQAYQMLPSCWTPFAVRWAFPTAIDYYGVLRPHVTTSGTATPVSFAETSHMGSLVLLICFSLNVGSIYTPEVLS